MKKQMKRIQGITLIALVVTIVVLLILAGVSINMLAGENGIITQAQDAKLESRAGNVREEVELWKTENVLRKNNNETQISKETMLTNLKEKGILYEEEIDRQNEIIKIGKNEIPYGTEVTINISKTPETKLSEAVFLRVTSVEGLGENIQLESEEQYAELLLNRLNSMSNEEREAIYVDVLNSMSQAEGADIHFENFDDFLQFMHEEGQIEEPTREFFYQMLENMGGIELLNKETAYAISYCNYNLIGEFNHDTLMLTAYIILNPDNEKKDYYVVKQNGDYTFKVKDGITGKEYNKTINVNNIGNSDKYNVDYVGKFIGSYNAGYIGLLDKDINTPTTFNSAFVIYNNETIEITDFIRANKNNNMSYIDFLELKNKLGRGIWNTYQTFIFEKDGIFYSELVKVDWVE